MVEKKTEKTCVDCGTKFKVAKYLIKRKIRCDDCQRKKTHSYISKKTNERRKEERKKLKELKELKEHKKIEIKEEDDGFRPI